jgi:hypothetical protein
MVPDILKALQFFKMSGTTHLKMQHHIPGDLEALTVVWFKVMTQDRRMDKRKT